MGDHPTTSASDLKKLWQEWHVKGAILTSLMFQMLLLLLATFRKRTSNTFLQYLVSWVYHGSYMVAQATFILIVGTRWFAMYKTPFGLWAAIMLLHLAGQERLTAYSLDDNDDWFSSFLGVFWLYFVHVFVVAERNLLPWSTIVMLFLGFIRLCWRTVRLRMGTLEMSGFNVLPDPHPIILDDHPQPEPDGRGSDEENTCTPPMDDWKTLLKGHLLLRDSLRLVAGIKRYSFKGVKSRLCSSVREFFCSLQDPKDAIRIVEVELNFLYESFHTEGTIRKHLDNNYNILYAVIRCFEPLLCVLTVLLFTYSFEREEYSGSDFKITFFLLWGTVILEFMAYLMTVFSDWTIVALKYKIGEHSIGKSLLSFLPHRRRWWSVYADYNHAPTWLRAARVLFRRWCETISKFSFLFYSIKQSQGTPVDYIRPEVFTGVSSAIRSYKFVSSQWYTDGLGSFVFDQLNGRKDNLTISSLRNRWSLKNSFRRSVLKWHFITELLYNSEQKQQLDKMSSELRDRRLHSKLISEYMAYLLFIKPQFMSRLAGNPVKESDAAWKSIRQIIANINSENKGFDEYFSDCCKTIVNRDNVEKGFLANAVSAAKTLKEEPDYWMTISNNWVENLLYAASESDPLNHVRELCHGGELISLVWLLAFHLGFY